MKAQPAPAEIWIDDPADSRLDAYRNLRQNYRGDGSDRFIAEGRMVSERLIASDYEVLSLLASVDLGDWLARQSISDKTPVYRVDRKTMRQLAGFDFHRGVMACGRRRAPKRVVEMPALEPRELVLGLCEVTDTENVGSLIRTATAFGVRKVILGAKTADPFSRRSLRCSMATTLKQTFWHSDDLLADVQSLAARNTIEVIATTLAAGAVELTDFRLPARSAIVLFGNEGYGLPTDIQAVATTQITIPMHRDTDSLNVGVAAGIVLHHLQQR